MRLLVLGPTGVVGAEVVREALHDARFTTVMAISRRPLAVTHPRLETLLHADFRDFTDLRSRFSGVDAAICALGMAWPQADSEAVARALLYAALGAAVASPAGNPQIEAAAATYAVPRTHEVSSA